jgi:hypothetical protein
MMAWLDSLDTMTLWGILLMIPLILVVLAGAASLMNWPH